VDERGDPTWHEQELEALRAERDRLVATWQGRWTGTGRGLPLAKRRAECHALRGRLRARRSRLEQERQALAQQVQDLAVQHAALARQLLEVQRAL
jgi:hypothetical protein